MNTTTPRSAGAPRPRVRWLNGTVLGLGLASLFSDWSHEIATTVAFGYSAALSLAGAGLVSRIGTRAG